MMRTDGTGRLRFAGILLLAVVFAAGALAGIAFTRIGGTDAAAQAAVREQGARERSHESIFDGLGLTADQQQHVDAILQARREQMDAFWKEYGPRMEQIVDSARAEIRNVLTDEQRAELDRRRAERKARREAHEKSQEKQ